MPRGKQLDGQTVYNIMASYAITNSYTATGKDLGIPLSTVQTIVEKNQNKPEFVELRKHKKAEFSDECSEIIAMLLSAVKKKAEMLLNDSETLGNTKITDITTSLGTLYDKRALSQ